jgi:hypothetical protein
LWILSSILIRYLISSLSSSDRIILWPSCSAASSSSFRLNSLIAARFARNSSSSSLMFSSSYWAAAASVRLLTVCISYSRVFFFISSISLSVYSCAYFFISFICVFILNIVAASYAETLASTIYLYWLKDSSTLLLFSFNICSLIFSFSYISYNSLLNYRNSASFCFFWSVKYSSNSLYLSSLIFVKSSVIIFSYFIFISSYISLIFFLNLI